MYSVSIFSPYYISSCAKVVKTLIKTLPLPRCLHLAFLVDVGLGRDAADVAGAGAGAEAQSGSCWRLEKSKNNIFRCILAASHWLKVSHATS